MKNRNNTKQSMVETVLYERLPHEIGIQRSVKQSTFDDKFVIKQVVPEEAGTQYMSDSALEEMRLQKIPACADVVVTTTLPNGKPAVWAVKRSNPNGGNFGSWWMQGGMMAAGLSVEGHLRARLYAEGGMRGKALVFAGLYRTVSEVGKGAFCDTIQPCYFCHIPRSEAMKATSDTDHSAKKWMTKEDIEALSEEELNWYPKRVFLLAIETAPE